MLASTVLAEPYQTEELAWGIQSSEMEFQKIWSHAYNCTNKMKWREITETEFWQ